MTYYCEYADEDILITATALIDRLTYNRITQIGFDNLTSFQKERVQKACLKQCEYYATYGTDTEGFSSISVEDFSVSIGSNGNGSLGCPKGVSPTAYNLLIQTGLMCRRL